MCQCGTSMSCNAPGSRCGSWSPSHMGRRCCELQGYPADERPSGNAIRNLYYRFRNKSLCVSHPCSNAVVAEQDLGNLAYKECTYGDALLILVYAATCSLRCQSRDHIGSSRSSRVAHPYWNALVVHRRWVAPAYKKGRDRDVLLTPACAAT